MTSFLKFFRYNSDLVVTLTNFSNVLRNQNFHTNKPLHSVGHWRIKNGIPVKGKEYGPLTDLPDWSYADGRPAPLSEGQKRRIRKHREYCEKIIKLTNEVNECFDLNKQAQMEERKIKATLQHRLKSKSESILIQKSN